MTPEGRARAGRAVEQRIARMGKTITSAAREAGIDARTLRSFVRGQRWPTAAVRSRLCRVLDWPDGEIVRRTYPPPLRDYPSDELMEELWRRLAECCNKDQERRA